MDRHQQRDKEEGQRSHQGMVPVFRHEDEMGKRKINVPSVQEGRPAVEIRGSTEHSQAFDL
eukprot:6229376-Ditylum_brightwellii.AAC.1